MQSSEDTTTGRPLTYTIYDNLNEAVEQQTYDGDGVTITYTNGVPNAPDPSLLRADTKTSYDDQGRPYQQQVYSVDPSSGAVSGNALTTSFYYDLRGDLIATSAPGGLWTKQVFDGAGRLVVTYTTDGAGGTSWTAAASVANDTVLEQEEDSYDLNSNLVETVDRQRFDNVTGTGPLGSPTSGIGARDYYVGYYYDAADRPTAEVNVGTNGGGAWSRPGAVPTGSNTVLVTSYGYNPAGWVSFETDPAGNVTQTSYDSLGRVTQTIAAYTNGVPTASNNQTTAYTYDGDNHTLTIMAMLPGGTGQQTAYVYGTTTARGSAINSNDLLAAVEYPDPSSGLASASNKEAYTYNALGQVSTFIDRNGTTHAYGYDVLGRQVSDTLTTLGAGVDGSIRRIETAYNSQGLPYLYTSFDAPTGGNIVNQVEQVYNGLDQLTGEYQAHNGAVDTSSTPEVQYAYTEMAGGVNNSRLTEMIYLNGRILHYGYNSGLDDSISRLSYLADDDGSGNPGTVLEAYTYLGLDTVVQRAHPQTQVNLSYLNPYGGPTSDGGDQYTGLDRFGRVVDQFWKNVSTGSTVAELQYDYNADSNRLYAANLVDAAFSQLYGYNPLQELTNYQQGTLNSTRTGLSGAANDSQSWSLDGLGNFTSVTTNGTTTTESANADNELTAVGSATPTYDSNGNLTTDANGNRYSYDGWNRLVQVKNSAGAVLVSYAYDALGRRIVENGGTPRDLYYDANWNVIEERVGGQTQIQYVWSPVAPDTLLLRDRDTTGDGTLDERLYALQDANGNAIALVDTSGNVVERYDYQPYGVVTVLDASWNMRSSTGYGWQYLFQGKRYDSTNGLYDSRGRIYSPTLGRPLQQDPLGFVAGDLNLYRWEFDSPVVLSDPSGDILPLLLLGGGVAWWLLGPGAGTAQAPTNPNDIVVQPNRPLGEDAAAGLVGVPFGMGAAALAEGVTAGVFAAGRGVAAGIAAAAEAARRARRSLRPQPKGNAPPNAPPQQNAPQNAPQNPCPPQNAPAGGSGLAGTRTLRDAGTKSSNGPIQDTIAGARNPTGPLAPRATFNNRHGRLPTEGSNGPARYVEYEVPNPNLPKGGLNDWRLYHDTVNNRWYYSGNSHAGGRPGSTASGSKATFVEITGIN